uniref:Putative ovule protein n=1 Tax=Solanum chacoense TaxID=4108 RepID=A0A0V0GGL7_SOLCH
MPNLSLPSTISTSSNSQSPISPQLPTVLSIYQTFIPFSFHINNHPPRFLQKCRCIIYSSSH